MQARMELIQMLAEILQALMEVLQALAKTTQAAVRATLESTMSQKDCNHIHFLSSNLLRNPCGTEQLQHWKVLENGGDGWGVENNRTVLEGAEHQTCFVTSFDWCKKGQVIDLVKEGLTGHFLDKHQPVICISDWYAGRNDCGCVYEIEVQLLAADGKTVIQTFTKKPDPIPCENDQKYKQVYHEFHGYGSGVRYVNFTHRGKDTKFWKGHYGARITNSSVKLKCNIADLCPNPYVGQHGCVYEIEVLLLDADRKTVIQTFTERMDS
ncbi:F-box only protein 27-like [Gastrophryne carolinensis]